VFHYLTVGGKVYPAIPVNIHYRNTTESVEAVLDSGSEFSIFKAEVARALKIPVERGKERPVTSVSGVTRSFVHAAQIQLFERTVPVQMSFIKNFDFPFNLLGRDFFEGHIITFEEKKKQLTIEEA